MNRSNIHHLITTMATAARYPGHFGMGWWFSDAETLPGRFPTRPPTLEQLERGAGTRACPLGWEASTPYAQARGFGWETLPPDPWRAAPTPTEYAPGGSAPEATFAAYLGVPLAVAEALSGTAWVDAAGRPDPRAELWPRAREACGMRPVTATDVISWLRILLAVGPAAYLAWHERRDGGAVEVAPLHDASSGSPSQAAASSCISCDAA